MVLTANNDRPCCICSEIIPKGSTVTPIGTKTSEGKFKLDFCHSQCVGADDNRIPVCKHWRSSGTCLYQASCQFRHPLDQVSEDSRAKDTKRYGTWNRRRIYNEGRTGALRRWLVSVFGVEYLTSGSGIIDVAGGKGELSFEIVNLNQIPSTVIDPRPLSLVKFKRKLAYGFFHKNDILNSYNSVSTQFCSVISTPGAADPRLAARRVVSVPKTSKSCDGGTATETEECAYYPPKHIRNFFEVLDLAGGRARLGAAGGAPGASSPAPAAGDGDRSETGGCGGDGDRDALRFPKALWSADSYEEATSLAVRTAWTNKGLQTHEEEEEEEDQQEEEEAGGAAAVNTSANEAAGADAEAAGDASSAFVGDVVEAQGIVRRCSAVVGMHPDQAAEHIVEFGLRNNVPFAVIPCCVYSKQFPHRSSAAGEPVRSYAEFVEYLLAKDDRIGAVEMDFDGKNVMLYFLGNVVPKMAPDAVTPQVCRGPARPETWRKLSTSPRVESRSHSTASSH